MSKPWIVATSAVVFVLILAGVVVVPLGIWVVVRDREGREVARVEIPEGGAVQVRAAEPASPLLRHVVLFKFKEGTTPEDLKRVEQAFAALPGKIPQIADFEWGTDVSPEKLSKGHTHCFFVTFRNAAGRDEYLPHAAHQEFVALVKPLLDDVTVVDYFVNK